MTQAEGRVGGLVKLSPAVQKGHEGTSRKARLQKGREADQRETFHKPSGDRQDASRPSQRRVPGRVARGTPSSV